MAKLVSDVECKQIDSLKDIWRWVKQLLADFIESKDQKHLCESLRRP